MDNVLTNELKSDADANTELMLSIPGLVNQVALSIGSAIFFPKALGNPNPYKSIEVTVDDKPVQFVLADESNSGTVYPVPATSFNYKGISHIFRHHGIPLEFKFCVMRLAMAKNEPKLLDLAFTQEEQVRLITEQGNITKIA